MNIRDYLQILRSKGRNHHKSLLLLGCFVTAILFLSTKHVQMINFPQMIKNNTYGQHVDQEIDIEQLKSPDIDTVYTGNKKLLQSKTVHTTTRTTHSHRYFTTNSSRIKPVDPLTGGQRNHGHFINFQDIVNSNVDKVLSEIKQERPPLLDNTHNFRPGKANYSQQGVFNNVSGNTRTVLDDVFTETDDYRNRTMVLLVTYLRSGSTFTADLIQQASDLFYLYEPLKLYVKGNYLTLDSICNTINGTCRKQSGRRENIDNILNDISKFYNCDLLHVPTYYFRYSNKSQTMLSYDHCRRFKTQYNCLNEFQQKCRKSIRMIKSIRMNLEVAEKLLEEFPSLKVIHLLRDPRGSYQSRKNGHFLKSQNDLEAITRSNCDLLHSDLNFGFRLKKLYPERIKTIMYETVAEEPLKASRSIFRFLGLTEPSHFEDWVHNHTNAGYNNGYYDTIRRNSKTTASLWRKYINLKVVKSYDKNCPEVYKILGINPFRSYADIHNITLPSRYQSPFFQDFLN